MKERKAIALEIPKTLNITKIPKRKQKSPKNAGIIPFQSHLWIRL